MSDDFLIMLSSRKMSPEGKSISTGKCKANKNFQFYIYNV